METEQESQEDEETEQAEGGEEDQIVTPPDNLVAKEIAEGPQDIQQSKAVSSVKEALKAVRTGVHLQETRKPRMTPAARQRETLTNTMINYIQKANSNQEEETDDELDLTFAGIARQMWLHLDATQRQRVLNKIQTLVGSCIDNVLEGLPLMGAPQQPLRQAPMMSQNIMHGCPQQEMPTQSSAGGDVVGFYHQGTQNIEYNQNGLSFHRM